MVCSQASSRAIVAAFFVMGNSGVGPGWDMADALEVCDAGSEGVTTGVKPFCDCALISTSVRFLSRWDGGRLSGAPVMLRLMESASSSDGLAPKIALQDCNAKSALPSTL